MNEIDNKGKHFDDVSLNDRKDDQIKDENEQINGDENVISTDSHTSASETESRGSTPLGTPLCFNDQDEIDEDEMKVFQEISKKNGIFNDAKVLQEKYEGKIIGLQNERDKLQEQIEEMRIKFSEQEKSFNQTKSRLCASLDKANKQAETSRKELESMVMKYATSEREVIVMKKSKDDSEKKFRDASRDKEALMVRIKGLSNEKTQLMGTIDRKIIEISNLQKDYEKFKIELKDRDAKWKQTQAKFNEEVKLHQETQKKLENSIFKINQLNQEIEKLNSENESRSNKGEDEQENGENQLETELASIKIKFNCLTEENNDLTIKIQSLERERLDHERIVSKLKENNGKLKDEISEHLSKLAEMDQLVMQLNIEKDLVVATQKENERLKCANNELTLEMETCRHKEGELLEFTERLTSKTVNLQSEHNVLEQKTIVLQNELEMIKKKFNEISKENQQLLVKLEKEKESHQSEVIILAKNLAEKTKNNQDLKAKLDETENENKVLKKRQIASQRELNKELYAMKKKLDQYESQSNNNEKLSSSSRTSSSTSLDASSTSNHPNSSTSNQQHNNAVNHSNVNQEEAGESTSSFNSMPEFDKQMLIERILKLQRSLAKRNEKIDFLEEHNHQLMEDLKKKSKIIQSYVLREETGALSTSSMDDHKVRNTFLSQYFINHIILINANQIRRRGKIKIYFKKLNSLKKKL